jgi:hypothetical protein
MLFILSPVYVTAKLVVNTKSALDHKIIQITYGDNVCTLETANKGAPETVKNSN